MNLFPSAFWKVTDCLELFMVARWICFSVCPGLHVAQFSALQGAVYCFVEEFLWPLSVLMVLTSQIMTVSNNLSVMWKQDQTIWTFHFSTTCFVLIWIKSNTNQKIWLDVHFMLLAHLLEKDCFYLRISSNNYLHVWK